MQMETAPRGLTFSAAALYSCALLPDGSLSFLRLPHRQRSWRALGSLKFPMFLLWQDAKSPAPRLPNV
jgi:hypothetical protein